MGVTVYNKSVEELFQMLVDFPNDGIRIRTQLVRITEDRAHLVFKDAEMTEIDVESSIKLTNDAVQRGIVPESMFAKYSAKEQGKARVVVGMFPVAKVSTWSVNAYVLTSPFAPGVQLNDGICPVTHVDFAPYDKSCLRIFAIAATRDLITQEMVNSMQQGKIFTLAELSIRWPDIAIDVTRQANIDVVTPPFCHVDAATNHYGSQQVQCRETSKQVGLDIDSVDEELIAVVEEDDDIIEVDE